MKGQKILKNCLLLDIHQLLILEESEELFLESLACVLSREYSTFLKMLIIDDAASKATQRKDSIELISSLGKTLLSKRVSFKISNKIIFILFVVDFV